MMLTRQRATELFAYDPKSGDLTWRKKPAQCVSVGDIAGCVAKNGYLRTQVDGSNYMNHRIIWLMLYGAFPEDQVDHVNGDRADNSIDNLRAVFRAENSKNRKRPANNTSGLIGISWNKQLKKWQAYITENRKRQHLGVFNSIVEAACVRAVAESKFGFHANHGRA